MSHATDNPIEGIDTKIRISSNRLVDLANFTPNDVCRTSINRSLNNLKRFTGHYSYNEPLTVAQHTLLCKEIAKLEYKLEWNDSIEVHEKYDSILVGCTIHDWPEAYYTDLSSPMKRFLGDGYREKIKEIDKIVYGVSWTGIFNQKGSFDDVKEEVKHCDHLSLRIEQHMLFNTRPPEEWVRDFMIKYDTRQMFRDVAQKQDIKL